MIEQIASDEVIDAAYQWMCEKRAHHHFNGDVWQVRRWWQEKKPLIQQLLRSGSYRFRELRLIWGKDQWIESWSSMDAMVLKAIAKEIDFPILLPDDLSDTVSGLPR